MTGKEPEIWPTALLGALLASIVIVLSLVFMLSLGWQEAQHAATQDQSPD